MRNRILLSGFVTGLVAFCVMAMGSVASQAVNAKTPAALILDSVNVNPAPTPYSEIAPGTAYNLGKDGQLSFVHYGLCKEISITGGKVTFDAKNYKLAGGKVTKESAQPCPQQLSLAASTAVAGGVVMRGASATPELAPNANMVLVGENADQVSSAKLSMVGEHHMIDVKFDANSRKISSDKQLKEGNYSLILQDSNGKSLAEWSFKVVANARPGTVIVQVQ